jgi:hypothetical protein
MFNKTHGLIITSSWAQSMCGFAYLLPNYPNTHASSSQRSSMHWNDDDSHKDRVLYDNCCHVTRVRNFFSFLSRGQVCIHLTTVKDGCPFTLGCYLRLTVCSVCYSSNSILPAHVSNRSLFFLPSGSTCSVKLLHHSRVWWKQPLIWSSAWNVVALGSCHPHIGNIMRVWSFRLLCRIIISLLKSKRNLCVTCVKVANVKLGLSHAMYP